MLIVLLSECKRGFVALQLWLYWSAKVAVWQCKVACFEPSFVVHHACQRRNTLRISKITQTAQNSRISHQRFCCALSEEYWALGMQILCRLPDIQLREIKKSQGFQITLGSHFELRNEVCSLTIDCLNHYLPSVYSFHQFIRCKYHHLWKTVWCSMWQR